MEQSTQLQNLMTYTVFHIGVYISLLAVIMGTQISGSMKFGYFRIPFACFLFAGACGGIIASNIPEYPDFVTFSDKYIGIWSFKVLKYKTWSIIEHLFFWIGTLWIAIPFIFGGPKIFIKK